jgi:hypothetical protein
MGIWGSAARIAALGTDGTSGIGRLSLIGAIRLYRAWPNRDLWHPSPGSSHAGLSAARGGLGVAGVISALGNCGCMQPGMWKNDSNPCT